MASADDGHLIEASAAASPTPPPSSATAASPSTAPARREIADFFALCLVEAARYGNDPSIWIRELAQNARDADAHEVCFSCQGVDVIIDDDGVGMSRAVVTGNLLRLFSSSKSAPMGETQARAAGCFGVGFWSLLLAQPRAIEIDTVDASGQAVGVVVDVVGAAVIERPCRRRRQGTTVRLVAPSQGPSPARLLEQVRHHASLVMGLNHPIVVKVGSGDGAVIVNEKYSLAGLEGVIASVAVQGEGFSGFVGLSTTPRVELTHHGLRVVESSSLAALVPSLRGQARPGLGLVARIDVPSLRVLVDRRTVVEDETITRVVRACEAASSKLERGVLDAGAPLPWHLQVIDVAGRALRSRAGLAAAIVVACLVVGFAIGSLALSVWRPGWWRGLPGWPSAPWAASATASSTGPQTLSDAQRGMGPPRIDIRGQSGGGFSIVTRYVHDDLIIDVRRIPDVLEGLKETPGRATAVGPAPPLSLPVRASAQLLASGPTILPSSLVLWPVIARDEGRDLSIGLTPDGLPVIDVGPGPHRVDVYFALASFAPSTRVAPSLVPASPLLDRIVRASAGLRGERAVRAIADAAARNIRYAADADAAARFAADKRPFLERVASLRFGDCDVLNTVVVLALQRAGFEARLARGLVVRDDHIASELHAWAEVYINDRWLRVDVSPIFAVPQPPGIVDDAGVAGDGGERGNAGAGDDPDAAPAVAPHIPSSPTLETPRASSAHASGAGREAGAQPLPDGTDDTSGSAHRGTRTPTRLLLVLCALLSLVGGRLFMWAQQRRRVNDAVDDDSLTAIIVAGLRAGAGDHLGLIERPILPTSHGPRSLRDLRRLSARGRLAASGFRAPAFSPSPRVHLIDVTHPRVQALRAWLPPIVDDTIYISPALAPAAQRTLDALRHKVSAVFATVAVHPSSSLGIHEQLLCADDGRTHHITVGVDVLSLPPEQAWRRLMQECTTLWALRRRPDIDIGRGIDTSVEHEDTAEMTAEGTDRRSIDTGRQG